MSSRKILIGGLFISLAGIFVLFTNAGVVKMAKGKINNVLQSGDNLLVIGWTCHPGSNRAVDVRLQVLDNQNKPIYAVTGVANVANGNDSSGNAKNIPACETSSTANKFILVVPNEDWAKFGGKRFRVKAEAYGDFKTTILSTRAGLSTGTALPEYVAPTSLGRGTVNSVRLNDAGQLVVRGWACRKGDRNPVDVRLEVRNAGIPYVGQAVEAVGESNQAIEQCQNNSKFIKFGITVPSNIVRRHKNRRFQVVIPATDYDGEHILKFYRNASDRVPASDGLIPVTPVDPIDPIDPVDPVDPGDEIDQIKAAILRLKKQIRNLENRVSDLE